MVIKQQQLDLSDIENYFDQNESIRSVMPIDLNIKEYALKIYTFATHFCAYDNDKLVGFLGCYFNSPEREFAFITILYVSLKFQNQGIAQELLKSAIGYAMENNFGKICLEVKKDNTKAISVYKKLEFDIIYEKYGILVCEKSIKNWDQEK